MTTPDLLKRWLYGPDGWSLATCEMDVRVGGTYRYVWRHSKGHEMAAGGVFREVAPPTRWVVTERFDEAWYTGESVVTTILNRDGGRTAMTMILEYESREARDMALKSGMEEGVSASYDRLDDVLAAMHT
jgi:uncharacterized protein YndB with AHSA1/START domain